MENTLTKADLWDASLLSCSTLKGDGSLSFFQKVLLMTNGTVTDILGLYCGEAIKVKKLKQEIVLGDKSHAAICPLGTPVLIRKVLIGSHTVDYIYAESIFVFERLSRAIQYQLLETDIPIGLLWKKEKTETYREILGYKTEVNEPLSFYFNTSPQIPFLSRSYFVYHNQSVLGVITEKFPVTYFK